MQLTSLGFLFVLLPVGGLIYYFLRGAGRRRFLLGYSLLFVGLLSVACIAGIIIFFKRKKWF